ncbi:uncharacterized membrane protein YhaH (DUF805 family) [Elusimicrobium posterum]|uniref:DUF805 domain-containing protein n=1 Tax=Elusimicrobium posterum TaxID=3116653 RepID=UPI003C763FA8
MNHFINAYKNMLNFNGRASVTQFWGFFIFYTLVYLFLFTFFFNSLINPPAYSFELSPGSAFGYYGTMIFSFVTILPLFSLWIRRLHDINLPAAYLLLFFLPVIGPAALMIMALIKGSKGENKYGPKPVVKTNFAYDAVLFVILCMLLAWSYKKMLKDFDPGYRYYQEIYEAQTQEY